jgi:hypothetical protein
MPIDQPDLANVQEVEPQPRPLVELGEVLRERFGQSVRYRRLWTAAVEGEIPVFRHNARLWFWEDDLPSIAAMFAGEAAPCPPQSTAR